MPRLSWLEAKGLTSTVRVRSGSSFRLEERPALAKCSCQTIRKNPKQPSFSWEPSLLTHDSHFVTKRNPMASPEEIKTVWLNAHNAALTGLLTKAVPLNVKIDSPDAIRAISSQCVNYANQAVADLEEYENPKPRSKVTSKTAKKNV